jgi:hypothetical protein
MAIFSEFFSSANNILKIFLIIFFLFFLGRAIFIFILMISKNKMPPDSQVILYSNVKIIYPILGIAALGNILFILNFAVPLKNPLVYIFLILILCLNFKEKLIYKDFLNIYSILSISYLLILLFSVTDISFHYDAGYYHLNNQYWLYENKLIIGLVNIFWPLGIGSISEYIASFFLIDTTFITLHLINVIFVWFFYSYFQYHVVKKTTLYYPSIFMIIFSFLDNFGYKGGRNGFFYTQGIGAQDVAVSILFSIIGINLIYKIKMKEFNKIEIIIFFFLSLFIFQLKISGGTIFFLLLAYSLIIIRKFYITIYKLIKTVSFPITLFLLWMLKSTLQTGCLIFPLDISCMNSFDWYVQGSTKTFEEVTRTSSYAFSFEESILNWLMSLLDDELRLVILINLSVSLLILYIFKKTFFNTKINKNYNINLHSFFITISILYLIVTGPIPRYIIGPILFLVATRAYNIKNFKYDSKYLTLTVSILCLISVVMFPRLSSYQEFNQYLYKNIDVPTEEYILQPNGWVKPVEGDQCWNNLDCTMGDGNIKLNYENFYTVVYKNE